MILTPYPAREQAVGMRFGGRRVSLWRRPAHGSEADHVHDHLPAVPTVVLARILKARHKRAQERLVAFFLLGVAASLAALAWVTWGALA